MDKEKEIKILVENSLMTDRYIEVKERNGKFGKEIVFVDTEYDIPMQKNIRKNVTILDPNDIIAIIELFLFALLKMFGLEEKGKEKIVHDLVHYEGIDPYKSHIPIKEIRKGVKSYEELKDKMFSILNKGIDKGDSESKNKKENRYEKVIIHKEDIKAIVNELEHNNIEGVIKFLKELI